MNMKLSKEALPKCFHCKRDIQSAIESDSVADKWSMPGGAICFLDAGNFGSAVNDSAYDGHRLEIMICDDCITEHRGLVREYDTPGHVEARKEQSRKAMEGFDFQAALADATNSTG